MEDRILSNGILEEDSFERSIRPETLSDYVGQIDYFVLEVWMSRAREKQAES